MEPRIYNHILRYIRSGSRCAFTFYCLSIRTFYFYDVSECEGCDCQIGFCFIRLVDFISVNFHWLPNAIDWGAFLDTWNYGTMEELGALLQPLINPFIGKYTLY